MQLLDFVTAAFVCAVLRNLKNRFINSNRLKTTSKALSSSASCRFIPALCNGFFAMHYSVGWSHPWYSPKRSQGPVGFGH
jgi:hypothetical protein